MADSNSTKSHVFPLPIQSSLNLIPSVLFLVPSFSFEIFEALAKGQLISKGLSFAPKNEQKYFCISDLASKKRSNPKNKGTLYH